MDEFLIVDDREDYLDFDLSVPEPKPRRRPESDMPEGWHRHLKGNGWVQDTATVAETAYIGPNAEVYSNAKVFGNAEVSGDAKVSGNAIVYSNAKVFGNAEVSGNAKVSDNAEVSGSAKVSGSAIVAEDAIVAGHAEVSGSAIVAGNAKVAGSAKVSGNAYLVTGDYYGGEITESIIEDREDYLDFDLGLPEPGFDTRAGQRIGDIARELQVEPELMPSVIAMTRELFKDAIQRVVSEVDLSRYILAMEDGTLRKWILNALERIANL